MKILYRSTIINMVVFALLFTFVPIQLEMALNRYFRDYSFWFEYESVTPVYTVAGEKPRFSSKAQIYRPVELSWNDVIRCVEDGTMVFKNSYESSATYGEDYTFDQTDPQTGETLANEWVYNWELPDNVGQRCCLYTAITANKGSVYANPNKTQTLSPSCFVIEPPPQISATTTFNTSTYEPS